MIHPARSHDERARVWLVPEVEPDRGEVRRAIRRQGEKPVEIYKILQAREVHQRFGVEDPLREKLTQTPRCRVGVPVAFLEVLEVLAGVREEWIVQRSERVARPALVMAE